MEESSEKSQAESHFTNEKKQSFEEAHSEFIEKVTNDIKNLSKQKKSSAEGIPTFKINLDLLPRQRWMEIASHYKDKISGAIVEAERMLGQDKLAWGVEKSFSAFTKMGFVMYSEELAGIAEVLGQPLGKVALLQLAYEASTCCTSIVTHDENGRPIHFRSMDWTMPSLLPLTLNVEFIRNNELIFTGTTWCGYVGLLTGMRKNGYSISINYRRTKEGSFLNNLLGAIASYYPISFLVRHVFETYQNYNNAVKYLTEAFIIAPCYITIAGVNTGEGRIITRNRKSEEAPLVLDSQHPWIIQTNIDHWRNNDNENNWQDIEFSRFRRLYATKFFEILHSQSQTQSLPLKYTLMWGLMDSVPVEAFDTIYKTGMSAAINYYETRGRADNYPFGKMSYLSNFPKLYNLATFIDY